MIRSAGLVVLAVVTAVAIASLAVAALESAVGVPNASSVYLVAVAIIALRFGISGAILTAVTSVLVYDFLFVNPLHTLTVSDPGEWLNLIPLLFVGVTVGQLAALQRASAESALERERESRALFDMTRANALWQEAVATSHGRRGRWPSCTIRPKADVPRGPSSDRRWPAALRGQRVRQATAHGRR